MDIHAARQHAKIVRYDLYYSGNNFPLWADRVLSRPHGYRWQKRLVKIRRLQAARRWRKLEAQRLREIYARTRAEIAAGLAPLRYAGRLEAG